MARDLSKKPSAFRKIGCVIAALGLAAAVMGLAFYACALLGGDGDNNVVVTQPQEFEEAVTSTAPEEPAAIDPRETAPDYATAEAWVRHPAGTAREHEADVLFFLSTIYDDAEGPRWGQFAATPDGAEQARELCDISAGCFETVADVWVPTWRQLNRVALNPTNPAAARAELAAPDSPARRDLFAALDAFFSSLPPSRPYVLAGHGQGAELVKLALSDYLPAHPEHIPQLVAAYIAGTTLSQNFLDALPYPLPFATGPADVPAIVAWNTEGGDNLNVRLSYAITPGETNLVINPLLWTTTTTPVPSSLNNGAFMPGPGGTWTLETPGPADAAINPFHGTLICTPFVDMPDLRSDPALFGPDSFHDLDYAFYFLNLRSNVATRIAAFLSP